MFQVILAEKWQYITTSCSVKPELNLIDVRRRMRKSAAVLLHCAPVFEGCGNRIQYLRRSAAPASRAQSWQMIRARKFDAFFHPLPLSLALTLCLTTAPIWNVAQQGHSVSGFYISKPKVDSSVLNREWVVPFPLGAQYKVNVELMFGHSGGGTSFTWPPLRHTQSNSTWELVIVAECRSPV